MFGRNLAFGKLFNAIISRFIGTPIKVIRKQLPVFIVQFQLDGNAQESNPLASFYHIIQIHKSEYPHIVACFNPCIFT